MVLRDYYHNITNIVAQTVHVLNNENIWTKYST